jgi:23S rRNA pseudouridine1911/1915/1917 synthase
MKQRCAKAVNVAADVLRLVTQPLGRDIRRRPPDHAVALWILRCECSEAEVANLRRLFIDKQNVGRLHISMNQTLAVSCAKSSGNLDANVEHLVFRQPALRFNEIVETSVIDQFHHHIKLAVVHSQREYLYDVGMIHTGSDARLLLQWSIMMRFATEILMQQFERDEPLQLRVARLIHRAHSTGTKRLYRHKMVEGSLQEVFLTAVPADHPHQRFMTAGIERGTAYPTGWRHEQLSLIDIEIDCNIDEFESKRKAVAALKTTREASTTFKLVVPKGHARMRLDLFLVKSLPEFSRSRIQQLIRGSFIRVGGATTRPHQLVRSGDHIEVTEPPPEKIETKPESIPLEILYEDDDLIVINKAAGMTVHPGAGQREHTLVNALLHHCSTLSGIGGKERPGIIHRLDKETSGCLVAAKNDVAHRELSKQFAARTVEKIYLALVAGRLRKHTGVIEEKIGRHPLHRQRMSVSSPRGRAAKTEYRVLRSSEQASLIECRLHSGRTHQIRVHLHHIGNPVLGDKIYAPRLAKDFPRQMLHAWKLAFRHPRTGEWKNFEAPLPADFKDAIAEMRL